MGRQAKNAVFAGPYSEFAIFFDVMRRQGPRALGRVPGKSRVRKRKLKTFTGFRCTVNRDFHPWLRRKVWPRLAQQGGGGLQGPAFPINPQACLVCPRGGRHGHAPGNRKPIRVFSPLPQACMRLVECSSCRYPDSNCSVPARPLRKGWAFSSGRLRQAYALPPLFPSWFMWSWARCTKAGPAMACGDLYG